VKLNHYMPFRIIISAMILMVLVASELFAAPPTVTAARIGGDSNKTRYVLEIHGSPSFRTFSLANPNRIVIDLDEVSWNIGPGGASGKGLITNYRYGLYTPGTSRIVLDLQSPVKIATSFVIKGEGGNADRLVFDFEKVTQTAFNQSLSRPAAARSSAVSTSRTPASRPASNKKIIVLDPGHGGHDPGNLGGIKVNGVAEKNVTLSAANNIKKILEASGRYTVYMTREKDIYIKHRDRSGLAHSLNADLFVSIHADSFSSPDVRGATIYTLSETASDREAALLASRENKSDIIAGVDIDEEPGEVQTILIDLVKQETMNLSSRFANDLSKELRKEVSVRKRGVRSAGFLVLKGIDVPSILLEMGYLTNKTDATLLMQKETQDKIGQAILRAADNYFAENFAFN
jgi:N-acetylmuramoyl-L-alanine amidase